MKDTGIVRRIDELGRIVIPKEIRRSLRLKEGTPVQIYINKLGELTLSKYSPIVDISECAQIFCEVVGGIIDNNVIILDKDTIIATTKKVKDYLNKMVSDKLVEKMEERKSYILTTAENSQMLPIFCNDENLYINQIIVPILANSDIVGGIVAFDLQNSKLTLADVKILQTIAGYIAKQVEWKNSHF